MISQYSFWPERKGLESTEEHLRRHELEDGSLLWSGRLPALLIPTENGFDAMWALHPESYHKIKIHGHLVETPRYQQAYGRDYFYTGGTNWALPVPPTFEVFLQWGKAEIDERLNGVLLNWYDGTKAHYIGKHRDSTTNMIEGVPIVTISLGERRVFRLRPWRGSGKIDFDARNGTVFVLPYQTNLKWTHEVPSSRRLTGKRISITLRGFAGQNDD